VRNVASNFFGGISSVVQQAHFIKQHDLGAGGERSSATISPNDVSRARNAD